MQYLKMLLLLCSKRATTDEKTPTLVKKKTKKNNKKKLCILADPEIRSNSNCETASFELHEQVKRII